MNITATVETLTAEVRVLMVGNRQVTLSVARQLDVVELAHIEPFGRVHLDKDREDWVIGRDARNGALAVAKYQRWFERPVVLAEDLDSKVIVCSSLRPDRDNGFQLRWQHVPVWIHAEATQQCGIENHRPYGQENCDHWLSNSQDAHIHRVVEERNRRVQRHKDAAELPLIVLAGLR